MAQRPYPRRAFALLVGAKRRGGVGEGSWLIRVPAWRRLGSDCDPGAGQWNSSSGMLISFKPPPLAHYKRLLLLYVQLVLFLTEIGFGCDCVKRLIWKQWSITSGFCER